MIGAKFDRALRHLTALRVPILQPLTVRTPVLECNHSRWDARSLADWRVTGGSDDHQLLDEDRLFFEWRISNRFGHQRRIEFTGEDGSRQLLRISCAKLQAHLWIPSMIGGERS